MIVALKGNKDGTHDVTIRLEEDDCHACGEKDVPCLVTNDTARRTNGSAICEKCAEEAFERWKEIP